VKGTKIVRGRRLRFQHQRCPAWPSGAYRRRGTGAPAVHARGWEFDIVIGFVQAQLDKRGRWRFRKRKSLAVDPRRRSAPVSRMSERRRARGTTALRGFGRTARLLHQWAPAPFRGWSILCVILLWSLPFPEFVLAGPPANKSRFLSRMAETDSSSAWHRS
jgi:hypothetical protein